MVSFKVLSLLVLGFVLLTAAPSSAVVKHRPYLGHEELVKPAMVDGLRHVQHFEHHYPDGKHVRLHYDVEHHPDVVSFDREEHVRAIKCHESSLVVEFSSSPGLSAEDAALELHARIHPETRLVGTRHWGCKHPTKDRHRSILRVAISSVVSEGKLHIETRPASYSDFFKNAMLDFSISRFEEGAFKPKHNEAEPEGELEKRTLPAEPEGFFGNLLSDVWNGVKTIANDVTKAVETVAKVGKFLITGDYYGYNTTYLPSAINWNYDFNTGYAQEELEFQTGVVCSNCYMYVEPEFIVRLDIQDYQVINATAAVRGQADMSTESSLNLDANLKWSTTGSVPTISLHPLLFVMVGVVPVDINLDVPITLSVAVDLSAEFDITSATSASGAFEYGLQFVDDQLYQIAHHTISAQSSDPPSMTATADLQVVMSIMPVLDFQIDYIGGPQFSFKPWVELNLETESSACQNDEMSLALNWGLQVSAGGFVDIEFAGHKFYNNSWQLPVYSYKSPTQQGCVSFYSAPDSTALSDPAVPFYNYRLAPAFPLVGNVWAGYQQQIKQNCRKQYPFGFFSLQIVGLSEYSYPYAQYDAIYSLNIRDDGVLCIAQAMLQATLDFNTLQMSFVDGDSSYDFTLCTNGDVFHFNPTAGYLSSDFQSFQATTEDGCCQVVASREYSSSYLPSSHALPPTRFLVE